MKIARTVRFKKAWEHLAGREKVSAREAIANLTVNIQYPALRVKKIKGAENIREARASCSLRITFQIDVNIIILRNIGRHNETLTRP